MSLTPTIFKFWPEVEKIYREKKPLFDIYEKTLLKWNQKINLTSIIAPQEIREKHFFDALVLFLSIQNVSRETSSIIDIGTGNGIPGLILKLAQPLWDVTLLDSDRRKCDFLKIVSREMGLKLEVLHARLDSKVPLKGTYDLVVSRAAFKMKDLVGFAHPLLNEHGYLVSMKTSDQALEISEAEPLVQKSGFQWNQDVEYELPSYPLPSRHIYTLLKG